MVAPWDRRSESEWRRLQDGALKRWLAAVASYSPWWGERLERAGVDPGKVGGVDELRGIPTLREREAAHAGGAGGPALLLRPTENQVKAVASGNLLLAVARAVRRGGTAGKRLALLQEFKAIHTHEAGRDGDLLVAYTRSDLDRLHRAGARAAAVLGLEDTDYLVSAVPAQPTLGFWGVYHLALGTSMLALHPRGTGDPVDVAARCFAQVPATAVAVPIDEAVALAAALEEMGAAVDRVRSVVVLGVPPPADERAEIAAAWRAAGARDDVTVQALWAPDGARALWAECREGVSDQAGTGLHTMPDLDVVEVVDPLTGRVTEHPGDLTHTSLSWHGTALVRYQSGDYVERLDHAPCPGCGRTVPRVTGEVVPAAWQPLLDGPDGPVRVDLRGAAAVFATDERVRAWRVELRGPTSRVRHDRLLVEVAGEVDDADQVADRLGAAVGVVPHRVKVGQDARQVQGKVDELGSIFADLR